ncbi:phytoene desaturase [Stutzerimonas xanthomarina]|uniref:phytoene desaturase n=1 Tax=Stutzerimonas xanthomarina TaxID=271420 RepID=UPI000E8A8A53|nr:phytoene desaturase [Stutzerimonas xanthomarina]MBU0811952.1 phytoene desaturase [Gammaproteobacteria bacterium]HAW24040.1 phytoene desaturase [Pseudomonas sp.]MBK3849168.1 phytoene desaturase [Stutzerimonas xanthomarina]MBU0850936.1 phytoene desaturase [Gammaproteobacteria bacterium]MBU1771800.1 phytoene desaturase [Gammaproteobacteria bacterium]|tara:strand:- start:360 stop:1862 length:1503 start_codon:yes stop_codon:yes gene_type:complete
MNEATGVVKRAVVIGAGFGGLALAIRLQRAGIQTTVLEKRDKPGGRAYVYHDQGFTFDAGPTVITDPPALEELFTGAGKRMADYVELLPVSPFYRLCWEDGYSFDYVNDQAELDKQIHALNPKDVAGYQRFLAYSRAVYEEGYVKLGTVPFLSFRSMIGVAPQLAKLQAWRNVYSMVSSFVENERLRQALSFHSLLVGGNPFETSSIYALIHALERQGGVWFPRGGTGALVQGMVRLFEDLGGKLELNAEVASIELSGGLARTVVTWDGRRFVTDAVASNADVVNTYKQLLGHEQRGRDEAKRLSGKRFSMSLFVIHFGLKRRHEHLQHHTVCFGPRYRELIDEIFKRETLADDFSLYLHAPCVTDPSLAPEGCASHYVLAPVPHLGTADIDWAVEGPKYRDRIFEYLERHYIPGLREDLVTHRIFTPFDFRDELNAHLGSAFSLEPILTQSAWFRTHNRDDVILNLYIVGAGTHPGAGVPGVVGSAKATAGLMLEDLSG